MSYMIFLIAALAISLGVLGVAMIYFRHQRSLQEKKNQYQILHKECGAIWRRYESCQGDIDRMRANYTGRVREMNLLLGDVDAKRREIRDVLEILKEESRRVDLEMDRDLLRIIERRKGILQRAWNEYDGKKAAYLGKLQLAHQSQEGMSSINLRRDQEYQRWSQVKLRMERAKREYEALARRSVFSFGARR